MTTVIEKPMLFSAPMVRAILEGRKTQTRRVVNLSRVSHPVNGMWFQRPEEVWVAADIDAGNFDPPECWGQTEIKCPHPVGSRIWVRESHLLDPPQDGTWDYCAYTDGVLHNISEIPVRFRSPEHVLYQATYEYPEGLRWRPSIHMPRWASRITLEVTDVRVQRLQEIDRSDCIAEGIELWEGVQLHRFPEENFKSLWNSINGHGAWEQNPWVWAYTFRRLEGDHD